jgi:hypothetical protein
VQISKTLNFAAWKAAASPSALCSPPTQRTMMGKHNTKKKNKLSLLDVCITFNTQAEQPRSNLSFHESREAAAGTNIKHISQCHSLSFPLIPLKAYTSRVQRGNAAILLTDEKRYASSFICTSYKSQ